MMMENLPHHSETPTAPEMSTTIPRFSDETIALMGQANVDALMDLHVKTATIRDETHDLLTRLDRTVAGGNIGHRIAQTPHQEEIDSEVYAAIGPWSHAKLMNNPEGIEMTSKILYDLYRKHRESFMPLTPQQIDEDIEHIKHVSDDMNAITRHIEQLFVRYDNTKNPTPQRELLEKIRKECISACPVNTTTLFLFAYINTERIFGSFERLEAKTDDTTTIIRRFAHENPVFAVADDTPFTLRSINQLRTQYEKIAIIMARGDFITAMEQFGDRYRRANLKHVEEHIAALHTTATTALFVAEQSAFVIAKARDRDRSAFPHPLIDRYQSDPSVLMSITVLESEKYLEKVRSELQDFLQPLGFGPEDSRTYEYAVDILAEQLGAPKRHESLQAAKRIVGDLLNTHLDDVHNNLQPLLDVMNGQKPRLPKKAQKIRPEHRMAVDLHNELHKLEFEDQEKAVVVAIANGKWDEVKRLHALASAEYDTAVSYAADMNCAEHLTHRSLKRVSDFSLAELLAKVKVRFALTPEAFYKFNPHQKRLLDAALSELDRPAP